MNEFLTPKQLKEHQDEQAQPLLQEAIEYISKAMLDTPNKNGTRLLRVDLRFEPVMRLVVILLRERGWHPSWEVIFTQGEPNDRPSTKSHIRLLLDIAPIE